MFLKGEKVKHCHQQTYQVAFHLVTAAVTCIQNVEEGSKDTHPGSGGEGGGRSSTNDSLHRGQHVHKH